jgi:hypothetical protein
VWWGRIGEVLFKSPPIRGVVTLICARSSGLALVSRREASIELICVGTRPYRSRHGNVMVRLGYSAILSEPKAVGRASAAALVARIKNWLQRGR